MTSSNESSRPSIATGETLLSKAKNRIGESIPFFLPQEYTEVVIYKECPEEAVYLGKWGSRHFIGVRETHPEFMFEENGLNRHLTHELIHQRFSEIVGIQNIFPKYNELFPKVNFDERKGLDVCLMLGEHFLSYPPDTSMDLWGVSEAVAYMGEKYVYGDKSPLKEKLPTGIYPEYVKKIIIQMDEQVEFDNIPEFLQRVSAFDYKTVEAFDGRFVESFIQNTV